MTGCMAPRWRSGREGFTLPELLVGAAIVLVIMAGIVGVVDPGHAASRAQPAAIDIQQRLRAASESISADILGAGSGPMNGVFGKALGTVVPTVLPYRVGPRGDAPGTVRTDAITLITSGSPHVAGRLREAFVPSNGIAQIEPGPGCPVGDDACGLRAGGAVLLIDSLGQSDLFRVDGVAGASLTLVARGAISGRPFPVGAAVVPVTVSVYYLRQGSGADGSQVMSGDGDQSDLPLVDHVTRLAFELFGDPQPPRLTSAGAAYSSTYGPSPPRLGVDDVRDGWPAGENCTFQATAIDQPGRLSRLGTGTTAVRLSSGVLTDGPWCPDGLAPGRYDADLLRVRAVRVTIRAEASSAAVRGLDARWFDHPGRSRDLSAVAADQQVVFDVVPRALQVGR